jgi:hypothetical protein
MVDLRKRDHELEFLSKDIDAVIRLKVISRN